MWKPSVDGQTVLLGSPALMAERGIDTSAMQADVLRLQDEGKTVMVVAVDGSLAGPGRRGRHGEGELVPPPSPTMHKQNLRVVMLTGDNWRTAKAIARQVGLGPGQPRSRPR